MRHAGQDRLLEIGEDLGHRLGRLGRRGCDPGGDLAGRVFARTGLSRSVAR